MSKYNAKKVIVTEDGTLFEEALVKKYKLDIKGACFDSKMEGEYYQELLLLLQDGTLSKIELQPAFVLQDSPKIKYIADFLLTFANGEKIVVDVKGVETSTFRVKRKLFQTKYPELKLQIIKRFRGRWLTTDEIKQEQSALKKATNQLLKKSARRKDGRNGRI